MGFEPMTFGFRDLWKFVLFTQTLIINNRFTLSWIIIHFKI